MNNYDPEINSMELAGHWMHQLRSCLEMAKTRVKSDPEGAHQLLQPAADLATELLATGAAVESLTEQIQDPVQMPSLFDSAG
jgi:hypothetical protein